MPRLVNGDCREFMKTMPDHCVDLILTDEAVICGLTPEKACNFKEFAA